MIELDPDTLRAMTRAGEAALRRQVDALFAGKVASTALSFAAYRNGSAFLHGTA